MSSVSVALGERSYDIQIQSGALASLAASGVLAPFSEIAVLSNETVAPLYAEKLCEELRGAGKRVLLLVRRKARNRNRWNGRVALTMRWRNFNYRGAVW